jgi:hydroxymethylpyrimidine kinase/phosphomethylpyrimidine kinase/thiamine-phosphate diphosphorylase
VIESLGCAAVGCAAVQTVQNSQGVVSAFPVDPALFAAQIDALLSDIRVSAVKIGALGGAEHVKMVSDAILKHNLRNVVLDPVIASTSGRGLIDSNGIRAILERLLPLTDLVTPNLDESEALTGFSVRSPHDMERAAKELIRLGAGAALIKGGHLERAPMDLLVCGSGERGSVSPSSFSVVRFPHDRIESPHTHGSGCFLSSAIASRLAQGDSLPQAVRAAGDFLHAAFCRPRIVGKGRGFPFPMEMPFLQPKSISISGLYVVTASTFRGRSHEAVAAAAVAGGASIVQLRAKGLETSEIVAIAKRIVAITRPAGALFIVNDRVDVALAAGADGVHLGPDDLSPVDARRILGSSAVIGVSVSSIDEASQVAAFVTYLGVGAIFGSKTKLDAGDPVGVKRIAEIHEAFPTIPIVAIGGIDASNIAATRLAGASSAAVISAVAAEDDMTQAARSLTDTFNKAANS